MGIIERIDTKVWQAVSPLIVNEKDGSILVWIPPGEFEMGDGQDSYHPKHSVFLDGYYLGMHCITNRQYQRFVEETGHRPPDKADFGEKPIWHRQSYPDVYAEHPVVCVSWEDAQAYCAWAGLALPTEAQWERGARGPGNLLYPWDNNWDETKCRHHKNRGDATTCRAPSFPLGASGFGTMNQSGNVWEWCRDWYGSDYYRNSPFHNPEGPLSGSGRVTRGGSWRITEADGFRAARRGKVDPADRYGHIGFRPCLPSSQHRVSNH